MKTYKNNRIKSPQKAREIWKSSPNLLQALCDSKCGNPNNWWESAEISYELHDVLQDYAPERHDFGSHPGDGSDLGYIDQTKFRTVKQSFQVQP